MSICFSADNKKGLVIISEMEGEEDLYELSFQGAAEDFGFDDQSDYLPSVEAYEIATEIADETNSSIKWEGYKPAWAS